MRHLSWHFRAGLILLLAVTEGAGLAAQAGTSTHPLALVWRGPGACQPTCGTSAAKVARLAGFRTLSVYPGFLDLPNDFAKKAFAEAHLWVQPGGKSATAAAAMGPELMERVRQFVSDGGGYVGFCAGMFLATEKIGTSAHTGLGIIPGTTELFLKDDPSGTMLDVTVQRGSYKMYYSGGPKLDIDEALLQAKGGEVIAHYADGSVAGIQVPFGRGRVSVVGVHPEASWFWKLFKGIVDLRGERWFAKKMMKWADTRP